MTKKILAIMICAAMIAGAAGCGAGGAGTTAASGAAETAAQTETGGTESRTEPQEAAPSASDDAHSGSVTYADAVDITLSEDGVSADGQAAGTEPGAAVYTGNDIIYYEDRDTYDSGNTYGEGTAADKHTAEEAAANTVVYITEPGTYRLSGTLHGQIRVDLGEAAAEDPAAVVTLVMDGADITCDVAPAVIFVNVYECDGDASEETAKPDVDTSAAGANVIIADGSVNNVTGSHIARIYKDTSEQKKLVKQDGAFYSCMSLNISGGEAGDGVLNITADNEGLDTEMHLTINGGIINVRSQDDGVNTNEDGISVTTINGGEIHIISGLGTEGDGVDSNGWLVINGGTVIACANPASDSGLDSDLGSYINGGTVVALGSTMDWAESDSDAVTMNLQFASYEDANEAIRVTDLYGNTVFEFDPAADTVLGNNARSYMGAIVSSPEFKVGESYNVYVGGKQQAYTGTDVAMGPGGMGGQRPDGQGGFPSQDGGMPAMPDGETPPAKPDSEMPTMPDGGMPAMPDGETPPAKPDGGNGQFGPGQRPDGQGAFPGENGQFQPGQRPDGQGASGEQNTVFTMGDKVNAFSGVSDLAESTETTASNIA